MYVSAAGDKAKVRFVGSNGQAQEILIDPNDLKGAKVSELGGNRFHVTANGKKTLVVLRENDTTSLNQGLAVKKQKYTVILAVVGLVGIAVVATCGLHARYTCYRSGVRRRYVISFSRGLCYVECK